MSSKVQRDWRQQMQLGWSYLNPRNLGGVGLLSLYSLMVLALVWKNLENLDIGRRHLH